MTLYRHEIKMNRFSFLIWLLGVAAMAGGCIFLFPLIDDSMGDLSDAFASMGGFSAAFGMDRLSIATLEGFFGTEIGTIYSLGGGMFAALLGIVSLSKEESAHTAEFLHTLTLGRCGIVMGKLAAIVTYIIAFGLVHLGVFFGASALIGESIDRKGLLLFMLAQTICQLELAAVCFALSALGRRVSLGAGLGLALVFYMLDIVARITDQAEWLKYITPFYFSNATDLFIEHSIDPLLAGISVGVTLLSVIAATVIYRRRDISA